MGQVMSSLWAPDGGAAAQRAAAGRAGNPLPPGYALAEEDFRLRKAGQPEGLPREDAAEEARDMAGDQRAEEMRRQAAQRRLRAALEAAGLLDQRQFMNVDDDDEDDGAGAGEWGLAGSGDDGTGVRSAASAAAAAAAAAGGGRGSGGGKKKKNNSSSSSSSRVEELDSGDDFEQEGGLASSARREGEDDESDSGSSADEWAEFDPNDPPIDELTGGDPELGAFVERVEGPLEPELLARARADPIGFLELAKQAYVGGPRGQDRGFAMRVFRALAQVGRPEGAAALGAALEELDQHVQLAVTRQLQQRWISMFELKAQEWQQIGKPVRRRHQRRTQAAVDGVLDRAPSERSKKAVGFLEQAAKKGNVPAMVNAGMAYARRKDFKSAVKLWRQAAEPPFNDAVAQKNVAVLLMDGSLPENAAEAKRMLVKSVAGGNEDAVVNLGALLHRGGKGIEKDEVEGVRLLRRGTRAQNHVAILVLGKAHMDGAGVERSVHAGRRLIDVAAEMGNPNAAATREHYNMELGPLPDDGLIPAEIIHLLCRPVPCVCAHCDEIGDQDMPLCQRCNHSRFCNDTCAEAGAEAHRARCDKYEGQDPPAENDDEAATLKQLQELAAKAQEAARAAAQAKLDEARAQQQQQAAAGGGGIDPRAAVEAQRAAVAAAVRGACSHCRKQSSSLLTCSRCKKAQYCNRTCQQQAWRTHKSECGK